MLRRLIGEDIELVDRARRRTSARVKADPGQIEQVMMNLVVNARDAMPERRHADASRPANVDARPTTRRARHATRSPGRYVMLAVSDTGGGMDAATRERALRAVLHDEGRRQGHRLGLATVYGIVKQSGGYIDVESEPGEGDVVHDLPPGRRRGGRAGCRRRTSAPEPTPGGARRSSSSRTRTSCARSSRRVLGDAGYRVLDARTRPRRCDSPTHDARRPAAHRRRHAADERPRARRAAAACRSSTCPATPAI